MGFDLSKDSSMIYPLPFFFLFLGFLAFLVGVGGANSFSTSNI
jgi:hypothetical protein